MRNVLKAMFLEVLDCLALDKRMQSVIHARGSVLEIAGDLYALDEFEGIRVIAFGKAAAEMAAVVDHSLGAGRASGLVVTGSEPKTRLPNFDYIVGGHPYPDENSRAAADAALRVAGQSASEKMLLLFLISGGGSAILEKPLFDDISPEEMTGFHRVLVNCGATIYEMNVLRKHFSAVKGGRLAVAAWPARQSTLYVSDVPADRPFFVASGPTMPDESTVHECVGIAERHRLLDKLPPSYTLRLRRARDLIAEGRTDSATLDAVLPETPKPGDPRFENSRFYPVLANKDAVQALEQLAIQRGWRVAVELGCDDWPLATAADYLIERLRRLRAESDGPACVISGGELSCPVTGDGRGGRNQAFALYCAEKISGDKMAVLSAGTDGIDGNSPATGATACGSTIRRAREAGLDARAFFDNSDSFTFFDTLGDTIVTGPTGNNVRDLRILIAP